MDTVLFDEDCTLCRNLAAYAERRAGASMKFISWQNHYNQDYSEPLFKNEAPVLRIFTNGQMLDGPDAWTHLLTTFPDLSAFNWLAESLNLKAQAGSVLHKAGNVVRRLCLRCKNPPTLR
jgi:predicted DCC family thiol-disulfide oxidoreductase YuxK